MYQLNPENTALGMRIQEEVLAPLMNKGGAAFWCVLTFRDSEKAISSEELEKRYITPFLLNLSRNSQSTITPFVSWWSRSEDATHQTHIHATIHSTNPFINEYIEIEWKHVGGGYQNKIQPFDLSLGGLGYLYASHKSRETAFYYEKPFVPPKDRRGMHNRPCFTPQERKIAKLKREGKWKEYNPHEDFSPKVIRRPKS